MATEVTVNELAEAIERGGFVLDVREGIEWESGHVPGATHIPMNEVPENLSKLDDGERIFVICQAGIRSNKVADYLGGLGYDVVSVEGGTAAWQESGRELSFEPSL